MKYYLVLVLLVIGFKTFMFGQITRNTDSSTLQLLDNLKEDECTVNYSYVPQIEITGKNALELIKLQEVSACGLYKMLSNDKNILVAHIILTHIYDPDNLSFSTKYYWSQTSSEVIGMGHTFNNVSWKIDDNTIIIDDNSIKWLKEYWNTKIN